MNLNNIIGLLLSGGLISIVGIFLTKYQLTKNENVKLKTKLIDSEVSNANKDIECDIKSLAPDKLASEFESSFGVSGGSGRSGKDDSSK